MNKKQVGIFEIINKKNIGNTSCILTLQYSKTLPEIFPGQFVEIEIPENKNVFLRRPFSVYDVDYETNSIKVLIKNVGEGTKTLCLQKVGKKLNLIFPLGNSFTIPKNAKVLLVGGGVGIAPMMFLSKFLKEKGNFPEVLYGSRNSSEIAEKELFMQNAELHICTDDGSEGFHGFVTNHKCLSENIEQYSFIYACGPNVMMKAVAQKAQAKNIPCEVSLENRMACGIGACLCCITPTTDGNLTTCLKGPVFDAAKLKDYI